MANSKNYPLETERLLLRLPQMQDAQVLSTLIGAWEVAVTTATIPHPYNIG